MNLNAPSNPPFLRVSICSALCIAASCLALAVADHRRQEHLALGFMFGTIFGQTTLAAAWTAWGPLQLLWRLPLSLLWLTALVFSLTINLHFHGGPASEVVIVVGGCMLGQWLLAQIPLWVLTLGYGLRLRHRSEAGGQPNPRDLQFGIRQLMILTAIVGVVFGIGRVAIPGLGQLLQQRQVGVEAAIFIFLAAAAAVITLPLVLAALLPRLAVPGVLLILVLIGLATVWELPLLNKFSNRPGPDQFHLIWINFFTAAWILVFAVTVRLNGYRLAWPARQSPAP